MLSLYHARGSLASQKVRLTLAEKGLEWTSRLIVGEQRRSPEYIKINRNLLVPSLDHDGQIIIESRVINEYLDEAFPEPRLQPVGARARARVHGWTAQDDQLHLNVFILSFLVSMREELIAFPVEEWEARAPGPFDPVKRERSLNMARLGFGSPYPADAVRRFRLLFDDMELALADAPWLGGEDYSLADTDLTPYLHRLSGRGLAGLWKNHPRVQDWFNRVQARPSFKTAIADWYGPAEHARVERAVALVRADLEKLLTIA